MRPSITTIIFLGYRIYRHHSRNWVVNICLWFYQWVNYTLPPCTISIFSIWSLKLFGRSIWNPATVTLITKQDGVGVALGKNLTLDTTHFQDLMIIMCFQVSRFDILYLRDYYVFELNKVETWLWNPVLHEIHLKPSVNAISPHIFFSP